MIFFCHRKSYCFLFIKLMQFDIILFSHKGKHNTVQYTKSNVDNNHFQYHGHHPLDKRGISESKLYNERRRKCVDLLFTAVLLPLPYIIHIFLRMAALHTYIQLQTYTCSQLFYSCHISSIHFYVWLPYIHTYIHAYSYKHTVVHSCST